MKVNNKIIQSINQIFILYIILKSENAFTSVIQRKKT